MCCSINFQISNEAATFWKRAFHETLSKRLSKFNNRIPRVKTLSILLKKLLGERKNISRFIVSTSKQREDCSARIIFIFLCAFIHSSQCSQCCVTFFSFFEGEFSNEIIVEPRSFFNYSNINLNISIIVYYFVSLLKHRLILLLQVRFEKKYRV